MTLRGKKIACFVALPHHSRFLWPVMEEARKSGAETMFFTTLSDYPFERDLQLRGVECRLLQSYATQETRKKIADTTSAFFEKWTPNIFQWDGMKHWPLVLQSGLLTSGLTEYHCLEAFIQIEKPDLLLALHERNRWGKLLGFMARKYGIAYLTLQEGDYYEDRLSFCAHTEYTTALMLWGEKTAGRLRRHDVSEDKIVLIGNTHLAQVSRDYFSEEQKAQTRKSLGLDNGKKILLFLVGLQWGVIKNRELWEELIKGVPEDVKMVFKWHPKVSVDGFRRDYIKPFKEWFPDVILVQNQDPYSLLSIADYCVALGKTTLAVEALSFGIPLFSLPGMDGEPDHYAADGIAQSIAPPFLWQPLNETMRNGVPAHIASSVEKYMAEFFHLGNRQAMERAKKVMKILVGKPAAKRKEPRFECAKVPGRISIIVPCGEDPEAFMATIVSLAEKVDFPDWELIVVIHMPGMENWLAQVAGDLRFVHTEVKSMGALFNEGAKYASGEILLFMRPGLLYLRCDPLQPMNGVVGVPIRHTDMTPYCFGFQFDFNSSPRPNLDEAVEPQSLGGGFLAVPRADYALLGGFDPDIANHLVEADFCLSMQNAGKPVSLLKQSLMLNVQETFYAEDKIESAWMRRIRFYAKWRGLLPKDEDFIAFAGERMRV